MEPQHIFPPSLPAVQSFGADEPAITLDGATVLFDKKVMLVPVNLETKLVDAHAAPQPTA